MAYGGQKIWFIPALQIGTAKNKIKKPFFVIFVILVTKGSLAPGFIQIIKCWFHQGSDRGHHIESKDLVHTYIKYIQGLLKNRTVKTIIFFNFRFGYYGN